MKNELKQSLIESVIKKRVEAFLSVMIEDTKETLIEDNVVYEFKPVELTPKYYELKEQLKNELRHHILNSMN